MNSYRTHDCGELRQESAGQIARISGWVDRKRNHGGLLFIDLRDMFGVTQTVIEDISPLFADINQLSLESVVTIEGMVEKRTADTVNADLSTGDIEIRIATMEVLSAADQLPMPVNQESQYPEEIRLKYRYLDLRRREMQRNIQLRNQIIAFLRSQMQMQGFQEFHTPILTASSPEGARDFIVPSRLHPGSFYALPQAPQQFKQLLMVAGFDKYFQIAPCFRDEDARRDRSPGEFYQLDFEMAFATQEDVFAVIEPVLHATFTEFTDKKISPLPFKRISYHDAMLVYGSDKPDLRNPLRICDVTDVFAEADFKIFANLIKTGNVVRAIKIKSGASHPRSFFDKINSWAQTQGQAGLGYLTLKDNQAQGPIAKNLNVKQVQQLKLQTEMQDGDAIFFICLEPKKAAFFGGIVRTYLAERLNLITDDCFEFCWVVDFPMFERDENSGEIIFSHNPFSMPQGGMEALENQDPLTIKAWQYDIVCNGIELSSGAIRNHRRDLMLKAFAIAGYSQEQVQAKFGGMLTAFSYGAPPHGGAAPGVERMVMLIADQANIREITPFPMTQMAQDLMMGAPCEIREEHLKQVHVKSLLPII